MPLLQACFENRQHGVRDRGRNMKD
jgi:hypothetical protein